jgi:hypothetical protein
MNDLTLQARAAVLLDNFQPSYMAHRFPHYELVYSGGVVYVKRKEWDGAYGVVMPDWLLCEADSQILRPEPEEILAEEEIVEKKRRAAKAITHDEIRALRKKMSVAAIARKLDLSRMTVYRLLTEKV